jgi:hypothetical protein
MIVTILVILLFCLFSFIYLEQILEEKDNNEKFDRDRKKINVFYGGRDVKTN